MTRRRLSSSRVAPRGGTPLALSIAAVVAGVLASSHARSGSIDAVAFEPSAYSRSLLSVATSRVAEPMSVQAGLDFHFTDSPLSFRTSDPIGRPHVERTVSNRLTAELLAAWAPVRWLEIGVAVPFTLTGQGADQRFTGTGRTDGFHVGGTRLDVKASAVRGEVFGLAFELGGTFPSASEASLTGHGFGGNASVVSDVQIGPVLLALNLGVHYRPDDVELAFLEVGHEWIGGAGLEVSVLEELSLIGESYARLPLTDPFGEPNASQLEAMAGVRWWPTRSLRITAGAGGGTPLASGYGTSRYQVFADARWRVRPAPGDIDGDGIDDGDDRCPRLPEDHDGYRDQDGCPDPDNDDDGLLDRHDECPDRPEDPDGFEDRDGCPDPDNDDDDIPDDRDECPLEPEDHDGHRDRDGCPDPDNDGDGIPDARDECPNRAETVNGFEDEDGCPDYPGVTVRGDRVHLHEPIRFDPRSHEPTTESLRTIRRLGRYLAQHRDIRKVQLVVRVGEIPSRALEAARREDAEEVERAARKRVRGERARTLRRALIVEGVAPGRLTIGEPGGIGAGDDEDSSGEGDAPGEDRVVIRILERR